MPQPWRRRLVSAASLLAVPIAVEWLISYIKDEHYSLGRAAVVLGAVAVLLLVLTALRAMTRRISLLLEFTVAVLGLVIAGTGVLSLTIGTENVARGSAVAMVCLGIATAGIAGYAIYLERTGADVFLAVPKIAETQPAQLVRDAQRQQLLTTFPSFSPDDEEVVTLCRDQLSADDVHFIGYYVNGDCRFHLDVLDSNTLNRFFRSLNRNQRRLSYERAGRQLDWIVSRLNTYVRRLDGGILIRTVLDVEQGALYYYWIDNNVYLTGLTMDQPKVLIADEKLRRLANAIGHLPRGGSYPEPPQVTLQVVAQDDSA